MHSSRQKKKISQQKKRHHDRVKAKGGAADTPACNKEHRVDNDTAQPQQIVVQPPAPLPQAGASKVSSSVPIRNRMNSITALMLGNG